MKIIYSLLIILGLLSCGGTKELEGEIIYGKYLYPTFVNRAIESSNYGYMVMAKRWYLVYEIKGCIVTFPILLSDTINHKRGELEKIYLINSATK
jgi:hypothetical protein